MPESGKAVFLSYAREDAGSARRIAEALRASGLEVWFDENELRGGDTWDAKIRKQIDECSLFVPLISANTQGRSKGYFRLEWKLAVDQTHLLAAGVPFIAPVVIDDTRESGALVPPEFMKVQWTRLPGALPTPDFVAQVRRLLEGPAAPAAAHAPTRAAATPSAAPASAKSGGVPRWTWGAAVAVIAGIATALSVGRKPAAPEPVAPAVPAPAVAEAKPAAPAPAPTVTAKSIAVLPFANLSADAQNAFFADGMHDEVITSLAKVRDLTVISRTSVLPYRKTEERNLRKIAAELGVAHVLEGSVQRAGDRVKVIVQLIDARTDHHLWAETYVENLTDVFLIQSKLAGSIATALEARLSPEEKSRLAARPTANAEAYDAYLKARAIGATLSPGMPREMFDQTVALLDQAVALDPAFTRAQAELCYVNGIMYWFSYLDSTPARRARAKAARDAVTKLGPDQPEARMARGIYLYTCENDWFGALAELSAAEAGLPNDAQIIYLQSIAMRRLGRVAESVAVISRAIALNPQDVNYCVQQLISLLALHRYGELRDMSLRYQERFPADANFRRFHSMAQLQLDGDRAAFIRREETNLPVTDDPGGHIRDRRAAWYRGDLAAVDRIMADYPRPWLDGPGGILRVPVSLDRAMVAHLRGRADEARKFAGQAKLALQEVTPTKRQAPWLKLYLGQTEALGGDPEVALRLLREGCEEASANDWLNGGLAYLTAGPTYLVLGRSPDALACLQKGSGQVAEFVPALFRLDPAWAPLRGDPRFEEILRAVRTF